MGYLTKRSSLIQFNCEIIRKKAARPQLDFSKCTRKENHLKQITIGKPQAKVFVGYKFISHFQSVLSRNDAKTDLGTLRSKIAQR